MLRSYNFSVIVPLYPCTSIDITIAPLFFVVTGLDQLTFGLLVVCFGALWDTFLSLSLSL